ncbi:DapH/DapD/GlmU-related protein [Maribacter sp. PR1]|uniref:DapH/DapD/GlmU-related protein n=1 Tax=Maribacter cobaltidurans TaxID=1178778 RepID=A0ABU7IZD1_9FLAO|nr:MULTISPECIES: DapH/DapD/GlmU-related protein [Maribacter]MDC6390523.1 DapH/DapD/GlmU-related protein [Maribacter sp. PR1]MEE1977913.1 DapH/DapD/GlmU-related protein [Maribacter cobaltidurans]
MDLSDFIKDVYHDLPMLPKESPPWKIISNLEIMLEDLFPTLESKNYMVSDCVAVHETALVENGVTLKPNTIIGPRCTIKSGSYFRNGVYLVSDVVIGANCEIKQSIILKNSSAAHLNYIGNSLIGEDVNLEAGSILANHFNERVDKNIRVLLEGMIVETNMVKFGSLIGDHSRIGANSVLNPGTILHPRSIVPRLKHIDQIK